MLRGTTNPADTMTLDYQIPAYWDQSLTELAPNVTQLVAQEQAPSEPWYDALARLLPALAATYQQKQLLQVQVDRARQGLAPLDVSQYAAGAQVRVGLDPKLQSLLIYGGVAALLLFAYGSLRRR